jgi:hypothetical protein
MFIRNSLWGCIVWQGKLDAIINTLIMNVILISVATHPAETGEFSQLLAILTGDDNCSYVGELALYNENE